MKSVQQEIDERTALTANNKFELMLFRLGRAAGADHSDLYGINVFKLREIVAMPTINSIANSPPHVLGVVNVRGQIITVIDLPSVLGCTPATGLNILLITEYARTTQAFAVEAVDEIVRLEWSQVRPAVGAAAGNGTVTSIAQLDTDVHNTRLAQVLDVEQILRSVLPPKDEDVSPEKVGPQVSLSDDSFILAADDSASARMLIEQSLQAIGAKYVMTKSGKEAWERLHDIAEEAAKEGRTVRDKVAMVLSDLEMPEMDGFTLTRNIKGDPRFQSIPVVIHSSLSGSTNEQHVKSVGANGYVAKFNAEELTGIIRRIVSGAPA
ncbi:chemotaxis protein [Noviherbaspirillum galbum]|uniref:Chemotaxis protein CheV n=1 Tax=Noviherbaspirillum galbum TaxID=2709383 RepID=A0A6B3SZH6_9BURK|nr:chemotaxis protein [Noviherbaspirillum galbum]NEX64109.1 chemotaxis protein CheV [Noviherbaspirillum galbum]